MNFAEILGDDTNILQQVHNNVEVEKIKEAIEKLDSKYKEIFILRFIEEKEYEEIGDILQIPTGTVSTLIYRAKKQLLIALAPSLKGRVGEGISKHL